MSQTQFSDKTRCIVYGLQARAVQGMLDFDFMCKRKKPSVAAMVYPFQGAHYSKFYWGTEETLVPVYPSLQSSLFQTSGRFCARRISRRIVACHDPLYRCV